MDEDVSPIPGRDGTEVETTVVSCAVAIAVGCLALPVVTAAETSRSTFHEILVSGVAALAAGGGYASGGWLSLVGAAPYRRWIGSALTTGLGACAIGVWAYTAFGSVPASEGTVLLSIFGWWAGADIRRVVEKGEAPEHELEMRFPPAMQVAVRLAAGCLLLFLFAGIAGVPNVLGHRHPMPVSAWTAAFVGYAVAGACALSSARFSTLRRRWRANNTLVPTGTGLQWTGSTAGLLLLAAVLCGAIGLGMKSGFPAAVLGLVVRLMSPVGAAIVDLLGFSAVSPSDISSPRRHLPPHRGKLHGGGSGKGFLGASTPTLILESGIVAAILLVLLALYFRKELRSFLEQRGWWKILAGVVAPLLWIVGLLRLRLRLSRQMMLRALFSAVRLDVPGTGKVRGTLFPQMQSPRERVLYYYRRMVRRAADEGLNRRSGQTPSEYADFLMPRLIEARGDVEVLTHAFEEARYSLRPVHRGVADDVHRRWHRIRRALRAVHNRFDQRAHR